MFIKIISKGYIESVGQTENKVPKSYEISESEHEIICDLIRNKPTAPEGYDYRLKADLSWELYELPPMPEDDEITDAEALEIIRGGAV